MRRENEGEAREAPGWREVYLPTINGSGYALTIESFETEEEVIAWARRWLDEQVERIDSGATLAMIRAARPSATKFRHLCGAAPITWEP